MSSCSLVTTIVVRLMIRQEQGVPSKALERNQKKFTIPFKSDRKLFIPTVGTCANTFAMQKRKVLFPLFVRQFPATIGRKEKSPVLPTVIQDGQNKLPKK